MRMRFPTRRLRRLVFVLALLFSWSGAWPALQAGAAAETEDQQAAERRARLFETLQRVCDVAEADLRAPGADPSDVPARAAALGHDPQKIFALVRDEVAYEPYRGVLRGPGGTLAGCAGNSADKALLLMAMLEAGGHKCRVVRGQLAPEKAEALVSQFLGADPAKSPLASFGGAGGDVVKSVEEYAARAGIDAKTVSQWAVDALKDTQRLQDETSQLTTRQYDYLGSNIGAANIKLGRPHQETVAELAGRAADHVWVQVSSADGGAWQNFDATFADAEIGGPDPAAPAEVEPAKLERHAVEFKLTYRFEDAGAPKDHVLIDKPIYADRSLVEFPQFRIMPADAVPSPEQMARMNPEQVTAQFRNIKRFQPVLMMGKQVFAADVFDLEGNLYTPTADGRLKAASDIAGAAGKAFGGAFGGFGGGGDAAPARKFVRLDVQLTFRVPGAEPRTQQRVLLTAEQTKGDHFLSPMLVWDFLLQGQALPAEWVSYRTLRHQVEVWKPVLQLLRNPKAGPADVNRLAASQFESFPALLVEFAQFRQGEMGRQLLANPKVAFLFDSPQLVLSEQRFCAHVKAGSMCSKRRVDIVDNGVHVVAREAGAATAAAEAAMRQGVFDTVAEATLLQRATKSTAESPVVATERARAGGARLVVATPADLGAVPPAALGDADRRWIAAYEPPARRVLVVASPDAEAPKGPAGAAGPAQADWWSLDPLTGTILGRSSGGHGQGLTEFQMTNLTYYACLGVTAYDMGRNASKQNGSITGKQFTKYTVQAVGCFALFMGGVFLPVKAGVQVGSVIFTILIGIAGTEIDVY